MNFGVVVFPGTWSDCDFHYIVSEVLHQPVRYVWHRDAQLADFDCLILPGGFSYGDYLRAGAVAGRSPVVEALPEFVAKGGLVWARATFRSLRGQARRARSRATSASSTAASPHGCASRMRRHRSRARCGRDRRQDAHFPRRGQVLRRSDTLRRVRDQKQIVSATRRDGRASRTPTQRLPDNIADSSTRRDRPRPHAPSERAGENAMGGTDGLLIFHPPRQPGRGWLVPQAVGAALGVETG
jgi:hypothetical protein